MFVYNDAMEINAIRTARLVLRPIGPEYLETTLAYAGDPVNTRLMMFMPLMSREEVLQYLENFQKEWAKPRPDACEFAILLDGQHIGEVGVDAFGQKPYYEDRGIMKRAIIAIGKQDTDLGSMTPVDERIEIMGGSSDHIILDVTRCGGDYKVGSVVEFYLGYGGMLKVMTSPYVEKCYRR